MVAPASTPDLLLARRAAAGRPEAWDDLIGRYGRRLYNLAVQFSADLSEAEDLTQEIFVRLFESLGRYRGDVPLLAWTLRLSRNLLIDHYRRSRRQGRPAAFSAELAERLPAADDPQAEASRRQQLRLVYEALAELPEELAAVVVLRDLQGFSYEETAAALGSPVGTVKSRLFRARGELSERIGRRLATPPVPAAGTEVARLETEPC